MVVSQEEGRERESLARPGGLKNGDYREAKGCGKRNLRCAETAGPKVCHMDPSLQNAS